MIVISVVLGLLAILGAPLFAVIATSAMIGFTKDETDLMVMAIEILGLAELPFLTAIPLFTFAGYLLSESNAPQRLVRERLQMLRDADRLGGVAIDQHNPLRRGAAEFAVDLEHAEDRRVRQFVRGEAGERINELANAAP